jgi:hypothetical protein
VSDRASDRSRWGFVLPFGQARPSSGREKTVSSLVGCVTPALAGTSRPTFRNGHCGHQLALEPLCQRLYISKLTVKTHRGYRDPQNPDALRPSS